MARRYADMRRTFAPSIVNNATVKLIELDVQLNPTGDGTLYARDGDFDKDTQDERFEPNNEVSTGLILPAYQNKKLKLDDLIMAELGNPKNALEALKTLQKLKKNSKWLLSKKAYPNAAAGQKI